MSRRLFSLAIAAAAGLASCKSETRPPPRPAVAPAPVAPVVPAAPAAAEPEQPEWSYTSVGKRDPFRSFLADASASAGGLITRCSTPLGRYELEQLRLVAVITGLEDPVAMVDAPNGVG